MSIDKKRARAILAIAIPAGLNSLLDIISIAIDLFMVGRLCVEASVALGVGLNYFMLIYIFSTVFFVGTNALVSRFFGAKDLESANRALSSISLAALLFGFPLFFAAFYTHESFFAFIGTNARASELGAQYLNVLIYIVPIFCLRVVMTASLSACGDTKTPFQIKGISTLLNVILNYIFIFGAFGFPALGVAGAALSTLGVGIMEVLILIYLLSNNRRAISWSRRLELSYVKRAFKVGFPSGVERACTIVSLLITTKLIALYGTPELAGYQIASRIEGFAFMPGFGFMVASMTLMGQSLGAKEPEEGIKYVLHTMILGAIFMGILGLVMIAIPEGLMWLFISDEMTIKMGALYLFALGFSQIPLSVVFVLDGALRGAGATRSTLLINLLSIWSLRILPAALIAHNGYALWGIYALISLETFFRAWVFWSFFKRGKWKNIKL